MKLPFIILLTLLLSGCKLFLESSLINNCSSNTKIIIQYEKELVPYLIDPNSFYKLINKSLEGNAPEKIFIDSANLMVNYMLDSKDTFFIKPALKFQNDTAYLISQISFINDQDTIVASDFVDFNLLFFNPDSQFHPVKLEARFFRDTCLH